MKKIVFMTTLIGILILFSGFEIHKFYVGVFQVDYSANKKSFQITSRIFIDDLEIALEKKFGKKTYLSTNKEIKEANALIATYFKEKLKISVNDKSQEMVFLTKEIEDDVIICYHKIPFTENIKSISISNKILIEQFLDQQNLLHTNINSNKLSFLFTNKNTEETISF